MTAAQAHSGHRTNEGFNGAPRRAGWRARLPVGVVILTLLALLLTPILVDRRTEPIRAKITEIAEPSRALLSDLELELAREAASNREFVVSGQPLHLNRAGRAREQQTEILARLQPLVGELGTGAVAQLSNVRQHLTEWHILHDRLFSGRMSAAEYLEAMPDQDELYGEVLTATARLRSTLIAALGQLRRDTAAAERLGIRLTVVLVIMALISVLFVVILGQRLERRHQQLAEQEARERFLAEASRIIVAPIEYEETLRNVAALALPFLADICVIDVIEDDGQIRRVASAHADPAREWLAAALERFPPEPTGEHPVLHVMRTGRPVIIPATPDVRQAIARDPEHRSIIEELTPQSIMVVPLVARGHAVGVIQFVAARPDRQYGRDDLALASDLGGRAALAIDNARLYRQARDARSEAERRAREEAALREAAAAISAAFTAEETTRRIAESALRATQADGAFVERIDLERDEVEVVAAAGDKAPSAGSRWPYRGSLTQQVIDTAEPRLISRIADMSESLPRDLERLCGNCSIAVIPLMEPGEPVSSLFLVRTPDSASFRPDELDRAHTFRDLARLSFHKLRLLQESQQRTQELARVIESRSRLMRGFTHDVKNPLGAADGFLQLLENGLVGELSEKQAENVARARGAMSSALALIEDLLALARTEAGQIDIRRVPTDVRAAVMTIADQYRAQIESRGLTLTVHESELPIIESDDARIRQVLGNLVSNAVKYTKQGRITLRMDIRADENAPGPGRWIAIDVTDTGPGIPEQQHGKLFQEFSRLEMGIERGAGVGLAIARRIARALSGDTTVRSAPGAGSTFTLWLPLKAEEQRATSAA